MSDWLWLFARDLSHALWLGGLFVIDFVETPARFRAKELDRNQIALGGRQVFKAFNRFEVFVGAVCLIAAWRGDGFGGDISAATLCVLVMLLAALLQLLLLQPRMYELTGALDFVNRTDDARYTTLRRLHMAYVALDLVKLLLGVAAFWLWRT